MVDITGATSDALRVLYRHFDSFDGARQASRTDPGYFGYESEAEVSRELYADGEISRADLEAVVELGEAGGFSRAEIEAAEHLLANEGMLDTIDVAAQGGATDGRISEQDVVGFINTHRNDGDMAYGTLAIADAAEILQVGRQGGTDDYDARMVAFAARVGTLDEDDASALLGEILRQDEGARASWLQPARLEQTGPDGERLVADGDYEAVLDLIPRSATQLPPQPDGTVRFVSFNIGQGATRGEGRGTDFDELGQTARIIADSDADIVAVQEIFGADVGALEEHLQDIEDARAEQEGREPRDVVITFSEASGKEWRHESGRYGHAGDGFGNAVITYGPQEIIYGDDRPLLPESGESRRIMGIATEVDGETVTVFNTHLSNEADGRAEQIETAFDIVAEHGGDGPVIFAGDFNQRIDGDRDDYSGEDLQAYDAFKGVLADAGLDDLGVDAGATGNWGYGSRIDYILAGGGATAEGVYRMDPGPGDHAALVADIDLTS